MKQIVKSALLQLNGHDRMKKREDHTSDVFNLNIMWTGMVSRQAVLQPQGDRESALRIHCLFGLKPGNNLLEQPFSRIDNAVLALDA